MARKVGEARSFVTQTVSIACGASNADNLVDLVVPSPAATLLNVSATQKVAGTGSGSFSLQIKYGGEAGGPSLTAVGTASSTGLVVAAATAGTIHGSFSPNGLALNAEGAHLNISTVKTGTVSGNATILVILTWQL
jgi:hypothetical protein